MGRERVFLYMDYFPGLQRALMELDVRVDRAFGGVHPFAMIGETEETMQHYAEECNEIQTLVSIRKNFDRMLTRNPIRYESNFKVVPLGKEVEYSNSTEWLILSFSPAGLPLFRVGNSIYSQVYPVNSFMKELQGKERIPFPLPKYFDWRYYAEKFADVCIENYESNRIILIRSIPEDWYISPSEIKMTDTSMRHVRAHIRSVEDVFIEKTKCHCIDDFLGDATNGRKIFQMRSYVYEKTASKIVDIIRNGRSFKCDFYRYRQPFIRLLSSRLNQSIISEIEADMDYYDGKTPSEMERHFFQDDSVGVSSELQKLSSFLQLDCWYTLSDYFRDRIDGKLNVQILELYTKYLKLDINDLLAVYAIYNHVADKSILRKVIRNICQNPDCYPINATKALLEKNMKYLWHYEYIDEEIKDAIHPSNNYNAHIFRLTETKYVLFNPESEEMIKILEKKSNGLNLESIFENNLSCRIDDMENLTTDWHFYIQRAKRGKGNCPVKIVFENTTDFVNSLFFFDFEDLLESENAIIALQKNLDDFVNTKIPAYRCKYNFDILLEENRKIFHMSGALADQIKRYVFSKYVEELSGADVLYDDITYKKRMWINGLEIDKVLENSEWFRSRCVSRYISPRLLKKCETNLGDMLFEYGYDEFISVISADRFRSFPMKCSRMVLHESGFGLDIGILSKFKYYSWLSTPEKYMPRGFQLSQYIKFPDFKDQENLDLSKEMLSCDAVVINIRIGDMYNLPGRSANFSSYKSFIKKILDIDEYSSKKYFFFSDDIPYVLAHKEDFGITLLDESDVKYITHNKGENSFWDMKLMSLGKIIICGSSGFGRMAGLLSERKEIFLGTDSQFDRQAMERIGWKNKYDLLDE